MEAFLTALCKAPSYKGLQPWHCFILEDPEQSCKSQHTLNSLVRFCERESLHVSQRARLVGSSDNTSGDNVVTCMSDPEKHTKRLLLCARTDLEDRIEQLVVEKDYPEHEEMEMLEYVASLSHRAHWSKHQLYLAFGYALASLHDSHIHWMEDFDVGSLSIPFYMIPTILIEWTAEQHPTTHTFMKSDLISTIHPGEHVGTFVPRMRYRHITPIHRRKTRKNSAQFDN